MKTTAGEHLQNILSQKGSALQKIFATYTAHQNIDREFQKDLPTEYQNHVKLLLYKGGVMTLGVSNSALLSRLTYSKAMLLTHFKQKTFWLSLKEIRIKMSL